MEQINEYDKILLGVLTLVIGGLYAMIMRHASKLSAHQRTLDQITGQLSHLPETAELVVRKIIGEHEDREDTKFASLHDKIDEIKDTIRTELIGVIRK